MREILLLLVAASVVPAVHVLSMAAVARLFRVQVIVVRLFYGPRVLRVGKVEVGCLPFGSTIGFRSTDSDAPPEPSRRAIDEASPWVTIAIVLGGISVLVVFAVAVLGLPGLRHVGSGFVELVSGPLAPRTEGARLVRALFDVAAGEGVLAFLAVCAAKAAAFNLMPLPSLNGGDILRAVLKLCGRTAPSGGIWVVLTLVVTLAASVCWAIALYTALWAGA